MKTFFSWKEFSIKRFMNELLFIENGGKKILNLKALRVITWPLLLTCVYIGFFAKMEDDSYAEKSISSSKQVESGVNNSQTNDGKSHEVDGVSKNSSKISNKSSRKIRNLPQLEYRAKQVISRKDGDPAKTIPIGTSAIGKLITSIDTRSKGGLIKVSLPYGFSYKRDRRIPKGTILVGGYSYPGQGDRVFISIQKGITPNGEEFEINAQALESSDYSMGIVGAHHSNADVRIATTLGLSLVSGMSDVLVEKQALGEAGVVTPKSTMKNAMYNGIGRVSEIEAQRQADQLGGEQEYVTVNSGRDLIISLITTYRGKTY